MNDRIRKKKVFFFVNLTFSTFPTFFFAKKEPKQTCQWFVEDFDGSPTNPFADLQH